MTIGHNSKAAITAELEEVKPVKTRKVLQIVCEVPMESADAALEALGGFPIPGESRPVAIALLQPSEDATETEAPKPKGGPLSKRAGRLGNNNNFLEWLFQKEQARTWLYGDLKHVPYVSAGAEIVRRMCGCKESRAELDHNEEAAAIFLQLESDFLTVMEGRTDEALREQARL